MRAGLWMPAGSTIDTSDTTGRNTFTVRAKVRPDVQSQTAVVLWGKISYFATGTTDFPWSLKLFQDGSFNSFHDSGNDFSHDSTLTSRLGFPPGVWYDVVNVHVASSRQALWVCPVENPYGGVLIEQTVGALAAGSRSVVIGRASLENGGGVGTTGYVGEVAHYEYWTADMLALGGQSWLRNWRPPMRRGGAAPTNLLRYIPFDDGAGSAATDIAQNTTRTITGSVEWRRSFCLARKRDARTMRTP